MLLHAMSYGDQPKMPNEDVTSRQQVAGVVANGVEVAIVDRMVCNLELGSQEVALDE